MSLQVEFCVCGVSARTGCHSGRCDKWTLDGGGGSGENNNLHRTGTVGQHLLIDIQKGRSAPLSCAMTMIQ